jgi:hypothetical protein
MVPFHAPRLRRATSSKKAGFEGRTNTTVERAEIKLEYYFVINWQENCDLYRFTTSSLSHVEYRITNSTLDTSHKYM